MCFFAFGKRRFLSTFPPKYLYIRPPLIYVQGGFFIELIEFIHPLFLPKHRFVCAYICNVSIHDRGFFLFTRIRAFLILFSYLYCRGKACLLWAWSNLQDLDQSAVFLYLKRDLNYDWNSHLNVFQLSPFLCTVTRNLHEIVLSSTFNCELKLFSNLKYYHFLFNQKKEFISS